MNDALATRWLLVFPIVFDNPHRRHKLGTQHATGPTSVGLLQFLSAQSYFPDPIAGIVGVEV